MGGLPSRSAITKSAEQPRVRVGPGNDLDSYLRMLR